MDRLQLNGFHYQYSKTWRRQLKARRRERAKLPEQLWNVYEHLVLDSAHSALNFFNANDLTFTRSQILDADEIRAEAKVIRREAAMKVAEILGKQLVGWPPKLY